MAFLRRSENIKPDYTSLQLQTSTSTLPIPIVWGRNRVAPNILWFANFQAVAEKSGGKGGGLGGAVTGYDYKADLIMALCEGPIQGVGLIYKDLAIYVPLELGLGVELGTTPQAVWPYLAALYPIQALTYQGTAYAWGASYDLGDSAAIGNHNFEIIGIFAGTGNNRVDADPALVINDFLTNAQYGCGFDPASIDATTLFGSGGDSSLQTYCKAMGYAFSPALVSQEQGSSILARWLQLLSIAAVWSGGLLKFIPYADTAISEGDETSYVLQCAIPAAVPETATYFHPPSIITVQNFVSDGGVAFAANGIPFTFIGDQVPSISGAYGMIAPGAYIFAAVDYGVGVKITYTGAAATSFTPNLTPVYELTDADFVDEKGNKDPVQVERVDVFSLPTIQRVEVLSRNNEYAATPVEARDQSQIEVFGPRVGSTIQGHEICDELVMGPLIAQTILQRELYVRTKFTFRLSWEYCLLDPMDVVTITDANLGLSNYPVRIAQIEEDDKGLLTITAEEFVTGVSTPEFYQNAGPGGFQPNQGVTAVPINAPLIYQPPTALTGGNAELWLGASGINGNGVGTQWGGAFVWMSVDGGTSYSQIGVISDPLRQGFLTAGLPTSASWDPADTLSVNLSESAGSLTGTTQASAHAGGTLSLVDTELLAYENATLTSLSNYNLTGIARGLSGTSPATHSSGAPFARLDSAVLQYPLSTNLLGRTLYLKFQSFNVFGAGTEDLSTCIAYPYTTTVVATVTTGGGGSTEPPTNPIATQLLSGFPLDLGSVESAPTVADDFGSVAVPATGSTDLGSVAIVTPHPIAAQLLSGVPLDLGAITGFASVVDDFGAVNDPVVDILEMGTIP